MSAEFLLKALLNTVNIQDKPGDDIKQYWLYVDCKYKSSGEN
jgi:hypothetical protein